MLITWKEGKKILRFLGICGAGPPRGCEGVRGGVGKVGFISGERADGEGGCIFVLFWNFGNKVVFCGVSVRWKNWLGWKEEGRMGRRKGGKRIGMQD